MPQSGPQATPPFVPGKTGTSSSSSTTTTKSSVPTEITEAFKGFLSSVFGQNPAVAAPGQPDGMSTPAVVGGLPPQLTPQSPLSMTTPVPLAPRQQSTPRQVAPAGTQFQSGAARNENIAATFGNALVSAIEGSKAKKESDNIARAQNTMNIFLHAVSQNDMATANLYASDPKITGMWEKYLKQEYKKVPGQATKSEATPSGLASSGIQPTQQVPMAPGELGGVNEPGGIAVPRDMTLEGQIRQTQLAAVQERMGTMSTEQIASTYPGMERAELTAAQSKQATMAKYGLALTAEQDATITGTLQAHAMSTWKEVVNFATGQEAMNMRSAGNNKASTDVANINAKAREAVAQKYVDANKSIADKKGSALQIGTYQTLITGLNAMALQTEKELKDIEKDKYTWYGASTGQANPDYTAKEKQRDDYLAQAKQVQSDLEGYKLMLSLAPGLFDAEAAKPDASGPAPTPEP